MKIPKQSSNPFVQAFTCLQTEWIPSFWKILPALLDVFCGTVWHADSVFMWRRVIHIGWTYHLLPSRRLGRTTGVLRGRRMSWPSPANRAGDLSGDLRLYFRRADEVDYGRAVQRCTCVSSGLMEFACVRASSVRRSSVRLFCGAWWCFDVWTVRRGRRAKVWMS